MIDFLKSLTLENWVDIAGVSGFILSVILAVSHVISNRMRISAGQFVLIDQNEKAPDSIFLLVTLSSSTNIPFSLTGLYIRDAIEKKDILFEKTVRTYRRKPTDKKLEVKPVVLSQAFPVRFDSYDAKVFLLELLRRNIDMKSGCASQVSF